MIQAVTEKRYSHAGHVTAYLEAGPKAGPAMIFVHGWPERAHSWRHQIPVFAGLGFRVIAPDLRGYGDSSIYPERRDYALENIVGDLIALMDGLDIDQAIWVGHDWGSPVVWSVASHHPQRCRGVASLCVPYFHLERGLDAAIDLVDRAIYPKDTFPAGQWDYQLYYQAHFEAATATFDANPEAAIKALFRKGDPSAMDQPAATATIRDQGGWFGGLPEAPDLPLDEDVLSEQDLALYVAGLAKNGFFGPDAYYMNHAANARYADEALQQGRLAMPVLFLAARYDGVCETVTSGAAEPMRAMCTNLSETIVDSGHWMAQECPVAVNLALVSWLGDHSLLQSG